MADDDTYGPNEVITSADGGSATVGKLAELAFWFDLEPGQTEKYDALRLHLLSEHGNLVACLLTDEEALEQHHDEHHGPCGIRNHDPDSTAWDLAKCQNRFVDAQKEREAVRDWDTWDGEEEDDSPGTAFSAHIERTRNPGQARTKPWKTAPKIYETPTRYTISILPDDDPWRRHYQIHVAQHRIAADEWTVEHMGFWADRGGNWEPTISGTNGRIMPRDEALELARRLAPTISGDGEHTALDVLNMPREGRR